MTAAPEWRRLLRALAALAVDPGGLKGIVVRARAGPLREGLDGLLGALPGPKRRIHPGLTDTQLFGGLDVAASLASGRPVSTPGLAQTPALLILPMAERTPPGLAARLSQLLDAGTGHALLLLDESDDAEEPAPARICERLAFAADLNALRHADAKGGLPAPADLDAARGLFPAVRNRPEDFTTLAALAARFGIDSLRAPLLAARTARALAALDGREETGESDLLAAAELVYPQRAQVVPEDTADEAPPEPQPPETSEEAAAGDTRAIPDEMLIEAVRACLPPALLDRLAGATRAPRSASGSGAGAKCKANRRGRPLPARPGRPDGRARIDIIATLRAAAPWQTIRRAGQRDGARRIIVHPGDIRLKRHENRSDRLLIFGVDASGSAAMTRLAEAKGAVELLLGQAYSRRDQVALIAFRGTGAELVLPPTRSLVQAKRRLTALPGGGGTPLAAGLREILSLTTLARGQGFSPALVLLTDGKANVALDGTGDRQQAQDDSARLARLVAAQGVPGLVIDISSRPAGHCETLAAALGGQHFPLPHADAAGISRAVGAAFAE